MMNKHRYLVNILCTIIAITSFGSSCAAPRSEVDDYLQSTPTESEINWEEQEVFFINWGPQENNSNSYIGELVKVGLNSELPQIIGKVTGSLAWSRDGQYLAAGCSDPTKICIYEGALFLNYNVHFVPVQPLSSSLLLELPMPENCIASLSELGVSSISWSRTNEKLAIVCQNQEKSNICILDLTGTSECWEESSWPNITSRIDWSPVSDVLLIDTGDQVGPNLSASDTDNLFEVLGNNIEIVNYHGEFIRELIDGWAPTWSPDGSKIALFRWDEQNQFAGLGVVNADGSDFFWVYRPPKRGSGYEEEAQKLTFEEAGSSYNGPSKISWSMDQKYLIVESNLSGSIYQIYRIEISTGEIVPITSNIFTTVQEPEIRP